MFVGILGTAGDRRGGRDRGHERNDPDDRYGDRANRPMNTINTPMSHERPPGVPRCADHDLMDAVTGRTTRGSRYRIYGGRRNCEFAMMVLQ
jgi:hypothetical protein